MILAIDSSSLTGVAVVDGDRVIVELVEPDTRAHAEAIGRLLAEALGGGRRGALEAVAVGVGPGPFTGLRVGIAAGRAVATALRLPLLPVVSPDAVALAHLVGGGASGFAVLADARRRERYRTPYGGLDDAGLPERLAEPGLVPADRAPAGAVVSAPVAPAWVARVAGRRRAAGLPPEPGEPRYLRAPDVTLAPAQAPRA